MFTKVFGFVFWMTFGVMGVLSSGWFIYLKLDQVIRREVFGQNLYRDSPDNWPFFFGCVVIFILCAYGIRKAVARLYGKDSQRDDAA
jgi:hypothetical protein